MLPNVTDRDSGHPAAVAGPGLAKPHAAGSVPNPYRVIGAGGREEPPVGTERHPDDGVGVSGKGLTVRVLGSGLP